MAIECGICRTDRPAPPGGVIHADGVWRVEHIHFHVVPRPPDLSAEFRGPKIFGLWAKAQAEGDQAPLSEVKALADRLRKALW
jgi:diadenosine tetraphosphate (Ap4A) HIT family hydrolase